jgi:hypothetical protein
MIQNELHDLLEAWKKEQSESIEKELEALMETSAYMDLPYHERNKGFITASKLKDYEQVPLFAMWRHIEGRETPFDDKDALTVGSAIDDRLTRGEAFYSQRYAPVARRTSSEAQALEASGRTLLTMGQAEKVDFMAEKARKHPLFPKNPKKKHLLWLAFGKYPCKAELDHEDIEERSIFGDFKSTASLPRFYNQINDGYLDIQMGFYFGGILEKYNKECECELYVMDKHDWCRVHVWIMRKDTLKAAQGRVNKLITDWAQSEDTGIWAPPDIHSHDGLMKLWNSPFYDQWEDSLNVPPTIV